MQLIIESTVEIDWIKLLLIIISFIIRNTLFGHSNTYIIFDSATLNTSIYLGSYCSSKYLILLLLTIKYICKCSDMSYEAMRDNINTEQYMKSMPAGGGSVDTAWLTMDWSEFK